MHLLNIDAAESAKKISPIYDDLPIADDCAQCTYYISQRRLTHEMALKFAARRARRLIPVPTTHAEQDFTSRKVILPRSSRRRFKAPSQRQQAHSVSRFPLPDDWASIGLLIFFAQLMLMPPPSQHACSAWYVSCAEALLLWLTVPSAIYSTPEQANILILLLREMMGFTSARRH